MENKDLIKIIKRIAKLEKAVFGKNKLKIKKKDKMISNDIDFSLNERAFVKRYVADKSGPKKFTLLLAYLIRGEVGKNMDLSEVRKHWNKMSAKSLLGKFNMFYPNDAKTRGWVGSKEYGNYCLTSEWEKVLWISRSK